MKKYFILTLAVVLTLGVASVALAQLQSIVGSAHDLRAGIGESEICVVCHTPHNAMSTTLIWNHEATGNSSFSMYSSGTIDGVTPAGATAGEPNGISKLCLGCHDGSTAIDNYGGGTGGTVNIGDFGGGDFTVGASGNLSTTHPISITYNDTEDLELNVVGTTFGTDTIADVLEDVGGDPTIQCSSCHEVHRNIPTGVTSLLRVSNEGSALCLICHLK